MNIERVLAPMQCMMGAQPVIAEWSESHPKWRVTRYRCGAPHVNERDI